MKLEVQGHVVEVDDSFGQMSPAEQEKTVNEIASSIGAKGSAEPKTPEYKPSAMDYAGAIPKTAVDIASEHPVLAGGLAYGAANLASKIPGVAPVANALGETFIPKYTMAKNILQGAGNWAENFAGRNFGTQAQALADLAHQSRMAGGAVDPEILKQAAHSVAQKMGGTVPAATQAAEAVAPAAAEAVAPAAQSGVRQAAGQLGSRLLGAGATALEMGNAPMAMLAPYQMAAHEQAKIRANPTAPEYANNPYAQTVRGEAATQTQAGAANTRQALIGQQYGGLSPEEQAIMQQERQRQMMQQQKMQKAKTILAQPPTPQNYMERMEAMATIYGKVRN